MGLRFFDISLQTPQRYDFDMKLPTKEHGCQQQYLIQHLKDFHQYFHGL
jgi:hypothetical protein